MKKKLGYTFYPKDWRSDDKIMMLNAEERDAFRFLIDECFIKSSAKLEKNFTFFRRILGHNSQKLERLFKVLANFQLIEETGDFFYIPSVEPRIAKIEGGKKGGEACSNTATKEKEKEKEKENILKANRDFYLEQRSKYTGDDFVQKAYRGVIDYILGNNEMEKQMEKVLMMDGQLNYTNFEAIMKKKPKDESVMDMLLAYENNPKYEYKNVYAFLSYWISNKKK